MESVEIVEGYAVALMGLENKPIPSIVHLQKELFLLSRVKPKLQEHFNFEKHYLGPFSQILNSVIEDSVYTENAFAIKNRKIMLAKGGENEYENVLKRIKMFDGEFEKTTLAMKMIRTIYEQLNEDELMLLIYETYPEYIEFSSKYQDFAANRPRKNLIVNNLRNKNLITEERYLELME